MFLSFKLIELNIRREQTQETRSPNIFAIVTIVVLIIEGVIFRDFCTAGKEEITS